MARSREPPAGAHVTAGVPPHGGQRNSRDGRQPARTSSFTITLDNYFDKPDTGNDVIATLPYMNDSNVATAGGTAGKRNQTVYVFCTAAAITAGKTVQAVTLPAAGTIPAGGGRTSGIHLFALGIGPLSAKGVPLSGNGS